MAKYVDQIHASHVCEHIPFKDPILLLDEIYRVIEKYGKLSISLPDASLLIKFYINKKRFLPEARFYQHAVV
jgi:predicted SAM-dependent methyltransferase